MFKPGPLSTLVLFGLSAVTLSAQAGSTLIPLTPCRAVDTRQATGPFGGPLMAAGSTRTFVIPQSACNIPADATAYSVNVTVIPTAGYVGYLSVWPAGQTQPVVSTLNDFFNAPLANAAIIPAGASGGVNVYVTNDAQVLIDINGYFVSPTSNTSTAVGSGASNAGTQNTALGFNSLTVNEGSSNTSVGAFALTANATGNNNTALGASALLSSSLGSANTAMGTNSLLNNLVGNDNVAVGFAALSGNTTGSNNVAIGAASLTANVAGSFNIAIGDQAGSNVENGYNIDIGNSGVSTDTGAIRIGTSGAQTSAYIAGISTSTVSGAAVVVNSNGQLGVATSSARFKEAIADIGSASDRLMQLRPVTFRYRTPERDGVKPLHYGLVAEEVEKVYPELVLHDAAGRPFALAYQELPSLLLNEVQRQRRTIDELEKQLKNVTDRLTALEGEGKR